jgi:prepilin-type N-terminal cleavage/methylation domain-containing protein
MKYEGFTMIEMLISMLIMALIFLAIGNVLSTMIKTSNTVSSRMLIREEGEFLAEIFRKYIRNSSADNVKLYTRENSRIRFSDYEVDSLLGEPFLYDPEAGGSATEIHFRPSADSRNKVVCMGFFNDHDDGDRGYLIRSVTNFTGSWNDYEAEMCFPTLSLSSQDFRKNFATLNSDLVHIRGLEIMRDNTSTNIYYSIDIDMEPSWGVGGLSNYRDSEGTPKYRKSFVVQTRQLYHW